jgi:hypothetical protein
LLLGPSVWWTIIGLALLGLFSAPLTIWAQTLRMQIIPEQLRGRAFFDDQWGEEAVNGQSPAPELHAELVEA